MASSVFLASLALSLLYLTVLSFGTTMVTYLLHTGFTPLQVSGMRIGAVIAELSGTWAAPFIMGRIGPIRSGLWFLNWQFVCLAAAVAAFAFLDNQSQVVAVSLIVGVALSRIGLWGFDLSVQFLVQEVSPDTRTVSSGQALTMIGCGRTCSRAVLIDRNGSPKHLRAPVFCDDHCIPSSRTIQVPSIHQLWGHCAGCYMFRDVCAEGTGTLAAYIQVFWGRQETDRP